MARTRSRNAWRVTAICAIAGLVVADVHAQAGAPGDLTPYSNDAVSLDDPVSIDDELSVRVAMFSRSLDEPLRLTTQQQARMVEIWQEERTALAHTLVPSDASTEVQRRAFDKDIALDDRGLALMRSSLDRLLARLTQVLSTEQLQRFAQVEQQKLEAQGRFLRMNRMTR